MPRNHRNIQIDSYVHDDKKRTNNPPVGLVSEATDKSSGTRTKYNHDPHIDPQLNWAGKQEGTSFEVPDVSLHVHERIDPRRIIKSFLRKDDRPRQVSLFEEPENEPPLSQAIDFYHHDQDWTNRLIAGDSLLVMNSLLQKEGMAGKVQTVYIDPPYGVKYNSNFQAFVDKTGVKDNNDSDIPAEPEMIQAFRDTWELGIHSYLTYLKDRLLLSRELLTESGSCFVQISDENLHHVREICDEVFGAQNFCSVIAFRKTSGFSSGLLDSVVDYLIWYAKDKKQVKYRPLFVEKEPPIRDANFRFVELASGERRAMTAEERDNPSLIPAGARIFRYDNLTSDGASSTDSTFVFEGSEYRPGANLHWKTTLQGMERLVSQRRIAKAGRQLAYIRYYDDFPYRRSPNVWDDTATGGFGDTKLYVVQTTVKTLVRCILMTTDPGDLVFDPTCGSGTAAFAAESWGRRWITCDTSRVAISLAKQRLMTAKYPYYKLAHSGEGVSSGFEYKRAPHLTLGSIANNEPTQDEVLYDQPNVERDKVRVSGPFTVEAVPSLRTKPFDGSELKFERTGDEVSRLGETGNQAEWRDELKATGIRATGGKIIEFSRIDPAEGTHYIHAIGEILEEGNTNKTAVISFGPDYGPIEQRQVEEVINEARELADKPDFVIFAAFQFDPEAAKDIDQIEWSGVQILKAQMSVDLLTADLRKKRSSNQSYWLIGQPDVDLIRTPEGTYKVKVNGFDYYNPVTGEVDSGSTKRVAMWFLDTNYDERSLLPNQVFFPMSGPRKDWTSLVRALNGAVDQELVEAFVGVESLPFKPGDNKKCAVKIIDDRGIESFVIKELH